MNLLLVAGEASADLHGASLLKELRSLYPNLHCFGVGGKALAEEGMEILVSADSINVVGLTDWWHRLREIWAHYRNLLAEIKRRRPDCAILLDLPDFNLMLSGKLKRLGIPVAYYISPQVWAWRRYRVKKIRRNVDKMMVLFPFEKEFYERHRVPCTFVGHPLLEKLETRQEIRPGTAIRQAPRIALLPGSRQSELKYHAPVLSELYEELRVRYPNAVFRVPVASTLSLTTLKNLFPSGIELIDDGGGRGVLRWADVAVVASGTATLETALIGTPLCLFYRMSRFSAFFCRYIVKYRSFLGMPNLLAGREVIREFFQEEATSENLRRECIRLLEDDEYRLNLRAALLEMRGRLGDAGASARAALGVSEVIRKYEALLLPQPISQP